MRQRLKITLSLLIAILLFGAFVVVSPARIFGLLETAFYQPRITRDREANLASYTSAVTEYHSANVERYSPVSRKAFVISAFRANQSQVDIFDRENFFGKLLEDFPQLEAVRLLGGDSRKIHYSTLPADLASSGAIQRKYYDLTEVDDSLAPDALKVPEGAPPRLILDGNRRRFIYAFPVISESYLGTALFYVRQSALSDVLLGRPDLDFRELLLVDRAGIVINSPISDPAAIAAAIVPLWKEGAREIPPETVILKDREGAEERFSVLSRGTERFGYVSLLVPYSAFELQPLMKAVLLASVFLTVFLVVFLIFNVRQDPLLVLSQRIKRFELELLHEFVDGKERVEWERWRRELIADRMELKSRIKRGLGRIPAEREAELDGMIDKSWDEIIGIIEVRLGTPQAERVDLQAIEDMIQRALDRGKITVAAQAGIPAPSQAERGRGMVVEEIGVEEVVDIPTPEVQGAEAEEVEELEEVAELEEAEAVEGTEAAVALEAVEGPEPVAELEGAEAVEELGAAEDELEELAELEGTEAAVALEEVGPVEELGSVEDELGAISTEDEVEELAEFEIAEQLRQVSPREALTPAPELGPEEEELAPVAEVSRESLEELETVREIQALAPLPQEVLEELPSAADEAEMLAGPSRTASRVSTAAERRTAVPSSLRKSGDVDSTEDVQEIEEIEETEELEELEEVGEAAEAGVAVPSGALTGSVQAQDYQFELLQKSGKILVYSLKQIERKIIERRTSVVMENGVFRVKKELYANAKGPSKGLRAIAESVLISQGGSDEESGIGSLFGEDVLVDLEKDIGVTSAGEVELLLGGRQKTKKVQFFDNGLDFDGYLRGFGAGKSATRRLKSLVELSGKLKAVNAVVFKKDGEGFRLAFKVGLLDEPAEIQFSAEEHLYKRHLANREMVLVRERPENLRDLAKKFNPDDLRYLQAAVFIPITCDNADAYLYMGLPNVKNCDLDHIIDRLDIY